MRISTVMLTIALAASTMMITQPDQGLAASKKVTAQTASWDGTWSGKWGGKASGKVTIKNNKVTSYYFQGRPQKVGGTLLHCQRHSLRSHKRLLFRIFCADRLKNRNVGGTKPTLRGLSEFFKNLLPWRQLKEDV